MSWRENITGQGGNLHEYLRVEDVGQRPRADGGDGWLNGDIAPLEGPLAPGADWSSNEDEEVYPELVLDSESSSVEDLEDANEARFIFPIPLCTAWRKRPLLDEEDEETPVKGLPKGNGAEK